MKKCVWKHKVQYYETDQMKVVHHSNYCLLYTSGDGLCPVQNHQEKRFQSKRLIKKDSALSFFLQSQTGDIPSG